jgi:hypothetical protein
MNRGLKMSNTLTQPSDPFTADGISMELVINWVRLDIFELYNKKFGTMPQKREYGLDCYERPVLPYDVSIMQRDRLSQIFPELYNNPKFRYNLDAIRLKDHEEQILNRVFITQRDFHKVVMILERDSIVQVKD